MFEPGQTVYIKPHTVHNLYVGSREKPVPKEVKFLRYMAGNRIAVVEYSNNGETSWYRVKVEDLEP
jgi:hypothetical protein